MIKLKNIISEAFTVGNSKPKESTPITYNRKTYYIPKDYGNNKKLFVFTDPELKKVAKHPNGGTLVINVSDIEYRLKK